VKLLASAAYSLLLDFLKFSRHQKELLKLLNTGKEHSRRATYGRVKNLNLSFLAIPAFLLLDCFGKSGATTGVG
jgi:hypothetical protein